MSKQSEGHDDDIYRVIEHRGLSAHIRFGAEEGPLIQISRSVSSDFDKSPYEIPATEIENVRSLLTMVSKSVQQFSGPACSKNSVGANAPNAVAAYRNEECSG